MESLEHKCHNISLPNYNKMLIFGKWAFFIMLFVNILINPIISKIQIFVTSIMERNIALQSNEDTETLPHCTLSYQERADGVK